MEQLLLQKKASFPPFFLAPSGQVDAGTGSLRELHAMGQSIVPSVFVEVASRLLEVKSDAGFPTLTPYVQNPFVVAGAGVQPRFAAHRDALDTSQLAVEVYGFKHRFDNDFAVHEGCVQKEGQTFVHATLVLHRAAEIEARFQFLPKGRQARGDALGALGDHIERQIAAHPHHLPSLAAPSVHLFEEEVRREARHHPTAWWDFPLAPSVALHRQVEGGRFAHKVGVDAVLLIAGKHVAMSAPFALAVASVDEVPKYHVLLRFFLSDDLEGRLDESFHQGCFDLRHVDVYPISRCSKLTVPILVVGCSLL